MNNNEFSQAETRQTASHEAIARRAEELWRQNGCPEGRDEEFWLEAERQVNGTAVPGATVAETTAASEVPTFSGGADGTALGFSGAAEVAPVEAKPSSRDAELMKNSGGRPAGKGRNRRGKVGGR